jgi:Tol biopolymer transport system component
MAHLESMGRRLILLALLIAVAGCREPTGDGISGLTLVDRHRDPRFTADGTRLVYFRHDERPGGQPGLLVLDLASLEERLVVGAIVAGFDVHPVRDEVIFSTPIASGSEPDLWLLELATLSLRRLTRDGRGHRWPAWSPDGRRLAWEVRVAGAARLDTTRTLWVGDWADTALSGERALAPGRRSSWRPDRLALVVERRRPDGLLPMPLVVLDTATGTARDTLAFGSQPVFRPDGAEVAYLAELPYRGCLGTCFVPGSGTGATPRALDADSTNWPGAWSRDGRYFAFTRRTRVYRLPAALGGLEVDEGRLWVRDVRTGLERQVSF